MSRSRIHTESAHGETNAPAMVDFLFATLASLACAGTKQMGKEDAGSGKDGGGGDLIGIDGNCLAGIYPVHARRAGPDLRRERRLAGRRGRH